MTPAVLERAVLDRPASLLADPGAGERAAAGPLGGGQLGDGRLGDGRLGDGHVTLEERLEATLRAVLSTGESDCPVCHARMTRAHEGGNCGGCGRCGSRLS